MSLLTNTLGGLWLMSPDYASGFKSSISKLDKIAFQVPSKPEFKEFSLSKMEVPAETGSELYKYYFGQGFSGQEGDRVGVVKLEGVMIKKPSWFGFGTDMVYDLLKEAGENKNIVSVLLQVNSPGGFEDSMADLSNLTYSFEAFYGKPIITLITGMGMSAAYWPIAGTSKVLMSNKITSTGSIGVMMTLIDDRVQLENEGIKEIVLYAKKSKDKGRAYMEAIEGNTEILQKRLDFLQSRFEEVVKRGRPKVSEDVFTGKEYYASEAIRMELADEIMSPEDALDYTFRLGMKYKKRLKN